MEDGKMDYWLLVASCYTSALNRYNEERGFNGTWFSPGFSFNAIRYASSKTFPVWFVRLPAAYVLMLMVTLRLPWHSVFFEPVVVLVAFGAMTHD